MNPILATILANLCDTLRLILLLFTIIPGLILFFSIAMFISPQESFTTDQMLLFLKTALRATLIIAILLLLRSLIPPGAAILP